MTLRGFGGRGRADAEAFDAWLDSAIAATPADRARHLEEWKRAPSARASHPREEHLLPLMVVAGAAGADLGRNVFRDLFAGTRVSAVQFG